MADTDGILDSTKQQLGLDIEDDSYDSELTMHINSTFFTLHQLGVGPALGFTIIDRNDKWTAFVGTDQINAVKTYMGMAVRLIFDPPATGPAVAAMERLVAQMEWRLKTHMEGVKWDEESKLS